MLDEDGPVFRHGGFLFESGEAVAGFNSHGNVEVALGFPAKDSMGGWDVGVVAPDGGADVAMVGDEVIGGIEAYPAESREECIYPGVGGVRGGAVVIA